MEYAHVRMKKGLLQPAKVLAAQLGVSLTQLISDAVEQTLDDNDIPTAEGRLWVEMDTRTIALEYVMEPLAAIEVPLG